MIRAFNGKTPKIADSAFVSEFAYVVGDVEIGEGSGVWPGAVIRGDFASIKIGRNCQIEDNSVVHAGTTVEIGDNVIIGHNAVIHGLKIGDGVLVGNNATILDYAETGDNCIIGANSMVSAGQKIPSNSLVVGVPAKVKRELSSGEIEGWYHKMAEKYSQMTRKGWSRPTYSDLVRKYKEQGL